MRRTAQDEFFQYLPVSERDRQWDLYVTGTGRMVHALPGDPDEGHPEPYYYVWENGRVLTEYGVVYVTQGEGEFESEPTGNKIVSAGTVILLFPQVWHRYRPSKETGWTYHWAHFGGGYPNRLTKRKFISPGDAVLKTGLDEAILSPYLCLMNRVQSWPPGLQQLSAANIMEILGAALAAVREERIGRISSAAVRQAKLVLEQHVEQLVDMKELAASLYLSYDRFRHVFKQQTGLAPYQYYLQLRINRAKQLLCGTRLSIKDIATRLEFESPYHFSTIFKEKTGISPTQWRGTDDTRARR